MLYKHHLWLQPSVSGFNYKVGITESIYSSNPERWDSVESNFYDNLVICTQEAIKV